MDGFLLKDGESVVCSVGVSKSAISVSWLSVPSYVLAAYLPLVQWGLIRLVWLLIPDLAKLLSAVFGGILFVLMIIWICICLVRTSRMDGKLTLTDQRILGRQNGRTLAESISDIVDVRLERSFWGKLFDYGTLTITTNGWNLTVKDLHRAERLRQQILQSANIRYYNK